MSVTVDPARLAYEMSIRGVSASALARKAHLSPAIVGAALAGRPIAATSLRLMAAALQAIPVDPVIETLVAPEVQARSHQRPPASR